MQLYLKVVITEPISTSQPVKRKEYSSILMPMSIVRIVRSFRKNETKLGHEKICFEPNYLFYFSPRHKRFYIRMNYALLKKSAFDFAFPFL